MEAIKVGSFDLPALAACSVGGGAAEKASDGPVTSLRRGGALPGDLQQQVAFRNMWPPMWP